MDECLKTTSGDEKGRRPEVIIIDVFPLYTFIYS